MGATKITWTQKVWNFLRGCSHASRGCDACYAEGMAARFPWGAKITTDGHWNGQVEILTEKLGDPLRWREPSMVFVNSVSDLFHPAVPFKVIAAAFGVMAATPHNTYQILTKRSARMLEFFRWVQDQWDQVRRANGYNPRSTQADICTAEAISAGVKSPRLIGAANTPWPLGNVWMGVTAEDQKHLDQRWEDLKQTPASVRFFSLEPLLEEVDLKEKLGRWSDCPDCGPGVGMDEDGCCAYCGSDAFRYGADWVIVGGESGLQARPFELAWARTVLAQCRGAMAPCFVKQLGARASDPANGLAGRLLKVAPEAEKLVARRLKDMNGRDLSEWPPELRVQEYPATDAAARAARAGRED
jgi:protein gp37